MHKILVHREGVHKGRANARRRTHARTHALGAVSHTCVQLHAVYRSTASWGHTGCREMKYVRAGARACAPHTSACVHADADGQRTGDVAGGGVACRVSGPAAVLPAAHMRRRQSGTTTYLPLQPPSLPECGCSSFRAGLFQREWPNSCCKASED